MIVEQNLLALLLQTTRKTHQQTDTRWFQDILLYLDGSQDYIFHISLVPAKVLLPANTISRNKGLDQCDNVKPKSAPSVSPHEGRRIRKYAKKVAIACEDFHRHPCPIVLAAVHNLSKLNDK